MNMLLQCLKRENILISVLLCLLISVSVRAKQGIEFAIESDFKNAISEFEKECIDYPGDKFYPDALKLAARITNKVYNSQAAVNFFKGMVYFQDSDYRTASKIIAKAIKKDSSSYIVNYYLGICYFNINLFEKAKQSFNAAIKLEPESGILYYFRGMTYHFMNDIDMAFNDYNKSEELNYQTYYLYLNRGKIYDKKGNKGMAENDYFRAYKLLTSESIELENHISEFRDRIRKAREEGDWIVLKSRWIDKREANNIKRGLTLNQQKSEINHILGKLYYNTGNTDIGISLIKEAIQIDRELMNKYMENENNYPHRKIDKLDVLFNGGIDILIDYYNNKGDGAVKDVYDNIKKVMNARIDSTRPK